MEPVVTQIEGVVLQVTPFNTYDRILTIFSPQGILKLFAKGQKRDFLHLSALSSPFTKGEFHFTQGKRDLHRLVEGAILKQNIHIRESYLAFVEAEKIAKAISHTQWVGKPAPLLYTLFSLFVEHMDELHPPLLSTAFLLKMLKHEGLLQLNTQPQATWRFAGECSEESVAPPGAIAFNEEEEKLLTEIALCRSLTNLRSFSLPNYFQNKIETLFSQSFES